jgi:2-hydroxy-3-keto-5-methylthiopentenyl-1-phosphate phosphatase
MTLQLFKKNTPVALVLDFDGTLTEVDVVDAILENFATSKSWMTLEEAWRKGQISSRECLTKQLQTVKVTPDQLDDYLRGISLDKGWPDLRFFLETHHLPHVVLSDGFDILIEKILRNKGLALPFVANELKWEKGRLSANYPHENPSCSRCGHCKRVSISKSRKNVQHIVFVGDGLSDVCALDVVDTVFAKGSLAQSCRKKKIPFIEFKHLDDVAKALPGIIEKLKSYS